MSQQPSAQFVLARRRQAEVLARDSATKTCSLKIMGDATQHDGVLSLPHYVPRVGDTVWCLQEETSWLIIGGQSTELPQCRISSASVRTTTNGAAEIAFDFAGGAVDIDTDGMAEIANDRINFNWPGKYLVGAAVRHESAVAGGTRRVADIAKNGSFLSTNNVVRRDVVNLGQPDWHVISMIDTFAAGDSIQLGIFGGNAGEPNVNWGDANYKTKLWAVYQL